MRVIILSDGRSVICFRSGISEELQLNGLEGWKCFRLFTAHMYYFFEITGESPDSFLEVVRNVSAFQRRANHARHILSQENWALLFMIWLRCYPTCHMLSALFNISLTTVNEEISFLIEPFHTYFSFVSWPTINEWRQMLRVWPKLPSAVASGCY